MVSPFAQTYGLYFDGEMESQDAAFEMIKETEKYIPEGTVHIGIPDTYEEFIGLRDDFDKRMKDSIRINQDREDVVYVRIAEGDGESDI